MGAISGSIARSAEAAGATIRTESEVARINVRGGVVKHFGVAATEAVTVYNGCPVENVRSRAAVARLPSRSTISPPP